MPWGPLAEGRDALGVTLGVWLRVTLPPMLPDEMSSGQHSTPTGSDSAGELLNVNPGAAAGVAAAAAEAGELWVPSPVVTGDHPTT